MRVGRPPRRNLSCAPISRRPPDRAPPLTATIPVRQGHPVISATHDATRIRLPAFGKPQPSARNMRARRIRELLVRSPGFSRRGPGLASQRAGRWRARPAKAGTPYQELASAPHSGVNKTIHSQQSERVREALVKLRQNAGLAQRQLARKLRREHSLSAHVTFFQRCGHG